MSAAVATGSVVPSRQCSDRCPCQQFQSDDETILSSAVELDVKADALIKWLAGSAEENNKINNVDDDSETTYRCAKRLRASITILNAIRDACRPFLETTTVTPDANTETNKTVSTAKKQQPDNNQSSATYEDSFPPLSFTSDATAAPPTLLVGRKKKKNQKNSVQPHSQEQSALNQVNVTYEYSFPPISLAPGAAAPTVLVGRKKKKNVQQKGNTHHVSKVNLNADKTIPPKEMIINISEDSTNGKSSALKDGNMAPLKVQQSKTTMTGSPLTELDQLRITDQTSKCKPIEKEKLQRLAAIYCAILKSHLAPFVLLELHLLMRLISLSDTVEKSQSRPINNKTYVLASIFRSEACCIYFVSQALVSLEGMINSMGYEIIKMFVVLPALQQHCPTLVAAMKDTINRDKATLIFETGQKALGSDSKTPHLTLPFDYERDSRHNYRSLDLSRLFKEREELRDSFLYQLRAFQEVRGKLMGNEESDNIVNSIKKEARDMMKNISPGNIDWFANLFRDLLLQIGLLPVGETDSEVLRHVTDKKRLQKLHMRFTSKSGQKSKSIRKLSLDQKGASFNEDGPEQSFQGHQEFFLMVLQAGDSYKFNTHLKRRLAQSISEMSNANETKGLCLHIAKLQLLAKFLGLLVFSPNWGLSNEGGFDVSDANSLPPLDLKMQITNAWTDHRLVVVIPWVVKFLDMMRWDASSKKLPYYLHVFALLRTINLRCSSGTSHHLQNNMLMLHLQLDALFHDVVGLVATQNLPAAKLPLRSATIPSDSSVATSQAFNQPKSLVFDPMPLWFSKQFLNSSIPYFEDLFQLLSDLTSNNIRSGNSCTKKVRPRSISLGALNSGQKYVSRISLSGDASPSPWSNSRPGTPADKHGIKERLIDSFFHQHKVLQELCEVIVDRVIKNASHKIKLSCIQPIFDKGGTNYEEYFNTSSKMSLGDYKKLLESLSDDCKAAGDKLVRDSFSQTIKGALTLLAPPDTDSDVLEIASSLASSHAIKLGEQIVRSAVSDEKNKLSEEFVRKESKAKAGVPLQNSTKEAPQKQRLINDIDSVGSKFQSLVHLTMALKVISDERVCSVKDLMQLKVKKQEVIDHVEKYFIGCDSSLHAIQHFEALIVSCISSFFQEPGKSSALLQAANEVMDVLSLLNMMGYLTSSAVELESLICNIKNIPTLTDNGPLTNDEVGNLLFVMIDGSLINHLSLEEVFLQLVRDDDSSKEVARSLFRLQDSKGQAVMVRLRKLLM